MYLLCLHIFLCLITFSSVVNTLSIISSVAVVLPSHYIKKKKKKKKKKYEVFNALSSLAHGLGSVQASSRITLKISQA